MTTPPAEQDGIEVIYPAARIEQRIGELARDIGGKDLHDVLVVAILKGSFIFAADLIRALHMAGLKPQVDFITLSSYGAGTRSKGRVTMVRDLDVDVRDRNVLVVDDILESGRTLAFARNLAKERGARRVATCVLLEKPGHRATTVQADFVGFKCPDVFVVGYGMDTNHRYRELPFIGQIITSRRDDCV